MRIAMIGTRGVPARYGGFETAVEEIGSRIAGWGHEVVVYCRQPGPSAYLGMRRVELPAVKTKTLDTLSHTFLSVRHAARQAHPDMAFVFNAANSPLLPRLRRAGIPVALHTDGLEWRRSKWGRAGRRYYLRAERLAVRFADELISDAQGIADYYLQRYDVVSNVIAYGAPIVHPGPDRLTELGLISGGYLLVVARFEPENHVVEAIEGALAAGGDEPVVVVGSSPYAEQYSARIAAVARNPRVRLLGGVWDSDLLDTLYAHCRVYVHGHSVGGTNPSLLRAMGAGAPVAVWDVSFNREVAGRQNASWLTPAGLAEALGDERYAPGTDLGELNRMLVAERYRWDDVARAYLDLAQRMVRQHTTGRATPSSTPTPPTPAAGPSRTPGPAPTAEQDPDGVSRRE